MTDPATNKVLGSVPDCNTADLDLAVKAAHDAFGIWRNYTAEVLNTCFSLKVALSLFSAAKFGEIFFFKQRSRILRKLFDLHGEHKQKLAEIITYENGKPLRDATVEIEVSAKAYEWFSEEAKRVYGDIIPSPAPNKKFFVVKQAVGVCGFIVSIVFNKISCLATFLKVVQTNNLVRE